MIQLSYSFFRQPKVFIRRLKIDRENELEEKWCISMLEDKRELISDKNATSERDEWPHFLISFHSHKNIHVKITLRLVVNMLLVYSMLCSYID